MTTRELLNSKQNEYGRYSFIAKYFNEFIALVKMNSRPQNLEKSEQDVIQSSCIMIFLKLLRIINGNNIKSSLHDSFDDIIGYAQLMKDHIRIEESEPSQEDEQEINPTGEVNYDEMK